MNLSITKKNVGPTDQLIRLLVGGALGIGAARGGSWIAGLIGAVLLVTAYLRFCPAYLLLKYNTNMGRPGEDRFDINKKNVGTTDQTLRALAGVLLIVGVLSGGWWGAGLIGAYLLLTALLRFCPFYLVFDYSTSEGLSPVPK
ncbi:DUF2892 domain-containing protein [uncultured Thiodictyon sp.]|uniref:YgaP family membrane protein n=1 Tax=uncultured Thiodictyon sp. TaxID=1846217 RepID=UPI0025FD8D2E|nr:DUF2892 domain-containing protein [uncultured Thiodictyon sp.]